MKLTRLQLKTAYRSIVEGLSENGSSFHAESKELREALKQIAQETEGTAGRDASLTAIAEIRAALAGE
jgi:hypothetical protein